MKCDKVLTVLLIGISVCVTLMGICLMFSSKAISVTLGIVMICLSLASGLLLPNLTSAFTLVAGIFILILSPRATCIIVAVAGIVAGTVLAVLWLQANRARKKSNASKTAAASYVDAVNGG